MTLYHDASPIISRYSACNIVHNIAIFGWRCDSMYRGMKYRDASVHRCIVPGLVTIVLDIAV